MSYEKIPLHLNKEHHRFEMNIDGEYAIINYRQTNEVVNLVHTEVAEELEGKGVAAALVEKTLQYIEEHHLKWFLLAAMYKVIYRGIPIGTGL